MFLALKLSLSQFYKLESEFYQHPSVMYVHLKFEKSYPTMGRANRAMMQQQMIFFFAVGHESCCHGTGAVDGEDCMGRQHGKGWREGGCSGRVSGNPIGFPIASPVLGKHPEFSVTTSEMWTSAE